MSKPSAAHVFGWAEMHPGACCDCCDGYCPRGDWAPAPDGPILRFEWAGRWWVSDRYISLDAAELNDVPAETVTPAAPVAGLATWATGAASGLIGDKTLAVLDRLPMLTVADSDVPNQMGRRGRCVELNPDYFLDSVKYLEAEERAQDMPSLFDLDVA